MKSLKEYLTESKKTYTFRVKVAGDVTTEDETKLRGLLDRFSITEFKKTGQTPVQSFPLDFPKIRNRNVNVWEVTLDYPTTSNELTEYLSSNLGRTNEELVVRSPYEPTEEYQKLMDDRDNPAAYPKNGKYDILLMDPELEDCGCGPHMAGEEHLMTFLKELNKEKHTLTQWKGVNDELLAKSVPNDSSIKEQSNKDADSNSPFANRKMPKPKGMR